MKNLVIQMYVKLHDLMNREEGQDLVEYALVVALIAFGSTAGMGAVATELNTAFNTISSNLASAI